MKFYESNAYLTISFIRYIAEDYGPIDQKFPILLSIVLGCSCYKLMLIPALQSCNSEKSWECHFLGRLIVWLSFKILKERENSANWTYHSLKDKDSLADAR